MVRITGEVIDPATILEQIGSPASGGIDLFVGTVRSHSEGKAVDRLEYSAYVPMAETLMREIESEIRARWPVHNVVLAHRIGTLGIGEVAVVTAVAAAHRREAFEACRHAIERIKADVPIWKKELWATAGREGDGGERRVHARAGG